MIDYLNMVSLLYIYSLFLRLPYNAFLNDFMFRIICLY